MGVLDKLLFWRRKTTEAELDIEGCFTLPGAEIGTSSAETMGEAVSDTMRDAVPETVTDAASATVPEAVAGQVDQVTGEVEQPADQAPAD